MKKTLILLITTIFVISCASNGGSNNKMRNADVSNKSKVVLADNTSDEKVVCKQIKKTGSHRTTTVCRSASEIEATRKATRNEVERTQFRSGPSTQEAVK